MKDWVCSSETLNKRFDPFIFIPTLKHQCLWRLIFRILSTTILTMTSAQPKKNKIYPIELTSIQTNPPPIMPIIKPTRARHQCIGCLLFWWTRIITAFWFVNTIEFIFASKTSHKCTSSGTNDSTAYTHWVKIITLSSGTENGVRSCNNVLAISCNPFSLPRQLWNLILLGSNENTW